ncbi:MAG: hypothetical protein ACRC4L_03850 [Mycoplasma sp.]
MKKTKIAFICVHNSCRSQIAEALAKVILFDVADIYSAGTEVVPNINKDAVRIINDLFSIDMTLTQNSKLIKEIPEVEILITMGCNVVCPNIKHKEFYDWNLEDPSNKNDDEFIKIINKIIINLIILRNKLVG